MDLEDGNTNELQLTLLSNEGAPLAHNSWIQFNAASQEIYAL